MAVLFALGANQWSVGWLAHRALNDRVIGQIHSLQVAAFAVGILLFFSNSVAAWTGRILALTRLSLLFRARPDYRIVLGVIPLALAMVGFEAVAVTREEIPLFSLLTLCVLLHSALFSVTLFSLTATVMTKLTHFRYAPITIVLLWAVLIPTDAAVYCFSDTRLEAQHLRQIDWSFIRGFLSVQAVAAIGTAAALCLASGAALCLPVARPSWGGLRAFGGAPGGNFASKRPGNRVLAFDERHTLQR
jgi:hypothetical protein